MSKVSRSDWSPVTWAQITGKPSSFGVSDIGQLTGAGFALGQVPRWNGSKFVPYTLPNIPAPTPPNSLPPQFTLTWDIPELLPLQTATQVFNVGMVFPGNPLAIGWSADPGFFWFWGLVTDIEVVTLYAKNMSAGPLTFGEVTATVQRFN